MENTETTEWVRSVFLGFCMGLNLPIGEAIKTQDYFPPCPP